MKDMDAQIGFIVKLKEESQLLRKNLNKQEAMCKDIKQYLAQYNENSTSLRLNQVGARKNKFSADDSFLG